MGHKVFNMSFHSIYKALTAKVERKGASAKDVDALIAWLMGYSLAEIAELKQSELTYGAFLEQAPAYNSYRKNITGKICGQQIETITDDNMQKLRQLDKLVDWLAKGKSVGEIKDKYEKVKRAERLFLGFKNNNESDGLRRRLGSLLTLLGGRL